MNTQKSEYVTRDTIMKLLSDDEVARVSTAETAVKLDAGDEYVDLEMIAQGVRKAGAETVAMGRALPRKAVLDKTWSAVVTLLANNKKSTGA